MHCLSLSFNCFSQSLYNIWVQHDKGKIIDSNVPKKANFCHVFSSRKLNFFQAGLLGVKGETNDNSNVMENKHPWDKNISQWGYKRNSTRRYIEEMSIFKALNSFSLNKYFIEKKSFIVTYLSCFKNKMKNVKTFLFLLFTILEKILTIRHIYLIDYVITKGVY